MESYIAPAPTIPGGPPPHIAAAGCEETEYVLRALAQRFEGEGRESRKLIRELAEVDWPAFYAAALEVLKTEADSRGGRYLVSLLIGRDELPNALCSPALNQKQAIALARAALQVDPSTDVTLANRIADNAATGGRSAEHLLRLLEILEEIAGGDRILPALRRIVRHPDGRLRSKAVLLVGRNDPAVSWLNNRLTEEDPRIRANAIEALWGVDSENARKVLHSAAQDPNNRVAGNALLALYRLGDCSSIPKILAMAAQESFESRGTAAWAMGEAADPRFADALAKMAGDSSAAVRSRAFQSGLRVKSAAAQARRSAEWRMAGRLQTAPGGFRKIALEAALADGSRPEVLPTQIIVTEDGRNIVDYQVEEQSRAAERLIVFVFPRPPVRLVTPWLRGMANALAWKHPLDFWAGVRYLEAAELETAILSDEPAPLQFRSDRSQAGNLFNEAGDGIYSAGFWGAIRRSLETAGFSNSQRRVIAFNSYEKTGPADYDRMVATAAACRGSIQAISLVPNEKLEELCRETRGEYRLARNEADVGPLIEQAHLSVLMRYAVSYRSDCRQPKSLRLRIHAPSGWGETQIAAPVAQ
jgi:hypothetical protein